jgi:hypothetical protein
MLIKKEILLKELAVVLKSVNAKRNMKNKVVDRFKEHGFMAGEITAIITGTNPLVQLTDEILYLLVWVLYSTVDDSSLQDRINPEKVLTDKEIAIAKNIKVDRQKDSIYPWVIENVNFDMEDDYSTVFSISKTSDLFDNRIIKYNFETQRPLISKWYNNQEVKEVFINHKNRIAIEKNIATGKQVSNYITLNILANGDENFEYDPIKRTLTIYEGTEVDILDGFHRVVSGRNAYHKDPTIKFNFKVRIVHWDVEKAKAFIHQETLGTQLDPLARKSYDVYNEVNQVVNKLNENPRSNLRGKITTEKSAIDTGKALIMFDVMFDSINQMFEVKNNHDVSVFSNYFVKGLNLITDNNPDLLASPIDNRLLVTYMATLKKYFNDEDWQEKLINTIDKIDVNDLQSIPYKTVNKTFINKVVEYVDSREV